MTKLFRSLSLVLLAGAAFAQYASPIPAGVSRGDTTANPAATVQKANGIRFADQYVSIQAAIDDFGAPGNCAVVYVPEGTYATNITLNTSNTCTNPSNMLTIRGAGRRNTILKPASNACVLTIDSTAGPVQGVTLENLSFDNTGTGFSGPTNNAICIQGNNINDEHLFQRIFIQGGFYNNISITGRCIWCKFEDVELDGGQNGADSFSVNNNAGSGLVGALHLRDVKIDGGTKAKRCFYMNTNFASNTGITIDGSSTFQNCAQEGAILNNIDGLDLADTDFEANGSDGTYANLRLGGTYMRGVHIHANHFLNSTTGDAIDFAAAQVGGTVDGNFIASGSRYTVSVTGAKSGSIAVGCNFEAFTGSIGHDFRSDINGNYHATNSCNPSLIPTALSVSGSGTPSVAGISYIRFINPSATTVTNFMNADPGQIVHVFNGGPGTVAFTFSKTGGFNTPSGSTLTLAPGQSLTWIYSPYDSRWELLQNSPLWVSSLQVNSSQMLTGETGTGGRIVTDNHPSFSGGIANSGTGLKHVRATTCTTEARIGATCTSSAITLPGAAFADTAYTLSCTLESPVHEPHIIGVAKKPGSFSITIASDTAAAAGGIADCIAIHD